MSTEIAMANGYTRMTHWFGTDPDRVDAATFVFDRDSLVVHGTSHTPTYSLTYLLTTGPRWQTHTLDVHVHAELWWRSVALDRDDAGRWSARWDGDAPADELPSSLPDLAGAVDCDLGLCAATNTMPILRYDLIDAAHAAQPRSQGFVMAWVSVPDLTVHRSEQQYEAADPVDGEGGGALVTFSSEGFRTVLEVDRDGIVVNYPGLARRAHAGQP